MTDQNPATSQDDGSFQTDHNRQSGALRQRSRAGPAKNPELTVTTTDGFWKQWAGGRLAWDKGRESGDVAITSDEDGWPRWLAATGWNLPYEPQPT